MLRYGHASSGFVVQNKSKIFFLNLEIRVFSFLIVTERDSPLEGPGPESRSWCAPIVGAPVQANLVTGNGGKTGI